ncbi:putative 115 kDa protein in type-1 retrotransposable element R1DM [Trichonephila clavipes]|nr:putative 115 kDa protein in type-1 retrotransposable element R1DM [Trichonephila clavipes]
MNYNLLNSFLFNISLTELLDGFAGLLINTTNASAFSTLRKRRVLNTPSFKLWNNSLRIQRNQLNAYKRRVVSLTTHGMSVDEIASMHSRIFSYSSSCLSPSEVEVVFRKLRGGKAPGIDLIDYAIWKALYNSFPNLLFRFFNLCIQFNHFPSIFKNTKIKFLLKPGRDPSSTLSYRPICLLSTLGKILERIFLNRFLRWISKNNILHRSQFGFREHHSCIEAVDKLVHHIKNTRVNKHTASTFIDIKSAFDNVDWSTLFHIFHSYRIPLHFQKFIHSYLTNRVIIWTDNAFTIKKQIFKGCPQGSVLSPTLWNIYFNPILSLNSELFLLQAFADDLTVVSFGLSRKELEDNTNKILSLVNSKLSEFNLSIATAKTVSVVFRCPFLQCRGFRGSTTFRRNPIFKIGSNSIHISKSYKYLGVNIDNRLSWTPHINSIKDKILWISSNFYRVSKNFNHQHISLMKLWYTSVVQPIISYGVGVWGGSLTSIQVQKLKCIQRIHLLKITKAYKISPIDDLNILSGIPPIHIVIRSLYFKFQLWNNRNDLLPGLIPDTKLDSFISLHQVLPDFLSFPINTFEGPSEWEVYTDGSKIDSNVGFAKLYNLYWVKAHNNKLYNDYADFYAKQAVYDGEVFSVLAPRSFLSNSLNKFILESFWTSSWNVCNTGLRVKRFFNNPKLNILPISKYLVHFLTNHGPFPAYLHRFNLLPSPNCLCGSPGDADHYVFHCPFTSDHHLVNPSPNALYPWANSIINSRAIHNKLISCFAISKSICDNLA